MLITELVDPIGNNKTLNPKLWIDGELKSEVRSKLLEITQDFIDFVDVPIDIIDVVIYGGNTNYTYTANSDIDLHIVVNKKSIDCDPAIDELFDSKRRLYKRKYNLTIYGIEVEPYLEDVKDKPRSASSYSLLNDKWLQTPNRNIPNIDYKKLNKIVKVWHKIIRAAMTTDDLQILKNTVNLLKDFRTMGLKTPESEFSIPNLTFKSLRNDQTIEKLLDKIDQLHTEKLTLK